jgi:hypothetical protein
MPIKSKKQKRFMQAVEHSPEFAKKVGMKQSVAREFLHPKKKKKKK